MGKIVLVVISVIVLILLLVIIASSIAYGQFSKMVKGEVNDFLADVHLSDRVIQEADLQNLPKPVQDWLKLSGVVGKKAIMKVKTVQNVSLRLNEEQSWMPGEVVQYFRTENPGFIWSVKIKAAPLVHIAGRDKYVDGHGNMMIKLLSLKTIADASGNEIDQGTLLRYLAEMMWFPSAALNDYIEWEEIGPNKAKATMSYQGVSASGVLTFNENHEITQFEADRYGEFDGEYRLEKWVVLTGDFKQYDGFNIPTTGKIIWKFKTGDFEWYRFEIKAMNYNF